MPIQIEQPKEFLFLLKEIKTDVEEIKEMLYSEDKIRPEFIKDVERVEKEMTKGKMKRFSKKEAEQWLKQM